MRHRFVAAAVLVVSALAAGVPAALAKGPPPADSAAQTACQSTRLMDVNAEYGLSPSQSQLSLLIGTLRESRTKGAAKLATQLFNAATAAAQGVARSDIRSWCLDTLHLRCSALECEGGNQVEKIRKKKS